MRLLRQLLDFYIHASLHVSVCFVALFAALHFSVIERFDWKIYLILFCGALIGYNLIKYGDRISKRRKIEYQNEIIVISLIAAGFCGFLLLGENWSGISILICAGLIGLLYIIPLYNGRGFRSIPVLKLLSVAIAWALLIVVYPRFSEFSSFSKFYEIKYFELFIRSIQIILLVIALCVPFEIRDLKYDPIYLKTLPQLIGVKRTKIFGIVATLLFFALTYYGIQDKSYTIILVNGLVSLVLIFLIWFCKVERSDYYSSFLVEAVPLFWLGLLWIEQLMT